MGEMKTRSKLTEQALETVQDGPSNVETYIAKDQNFERIPLGLESRPRNVEAIYRDWDAR